MNKKLIFVGIVILIMSLLIKSPVCFFPQTEVQVKGKTTEEDVTALQERLEESKYEYRYHTGMSMYPTIKHSQFCLCEKADRYGVGDILSFYAYINGELIFVSHRAIELLPDGWITKGDSNLEIDAWLVPPENVVCKIGEYNWLEKWLIFHGGQNG